MSKTLSVQVGPVSARFRLWPPELHINDRHIHHVWWVVPIVLSDWGDRAVWVRDLLHPNSEPPRCSPARVLFYSTDDG